MNVAFDSWIPVVTLSGRRKLISLAEVLTNGSDYADLAVRPHERVSLMRLFLCVAHASLNGPKDIREWREVPKKLPNAAEKYLSQWKDSLELFHKKKPWLQVAELNVLPRDKKDESKEEEDWSRLSRLCFERASGINTTLFDHLSNGGPPTQYTAEEIALNLLTFQNFFVAGGKASPRVWGKVKMEKPPNPKGGPCAGKSILFTFIRGRNLEETIHLNLSTHNDLKTLYGDLNNWLGQPLWEQPIKSPTDTKAIANATRTHLGRLVPQTRMLRINEDCSSVLMGPGLMYPKFQDDKDPFFPDQFATVVPSRNGDQTKLLSARPGISLWRQLHSLVVRRKGSANSSRGPLCLLNIPEDSDCDIIVNSMVTNPSPGKVAEILDFLESVYHIPSKLRSPQGTAMYEGEVRTSEEVARRLRWAIEEYRKTFDGGWEGRVKSAGPSKGELLSKLHSIATSHYWTTVEKNLSVLMRHVEALGTDAIDPTRAEWRKMLIAAGRESYELACGQESSRQIRAFAKGWQKLVLSETYLETILNPSKEKSS
jgi:CRISPR system Cascade subunit CasA